MGLPSLINLDAFFLSHTAEPVTIPTQESVDQFLPPYHRELKLEIERPITFGALEDSERYMELRYEIQEAQLEALSATKEVDQEFHRIFGRQYGVLDSFMTEDAETILVTSGTITTTTRAVVQPLEKKARKSDCSGCLFRPFPLEEGPWRSRMQNVVHNRPQFLLRCDGNFAQEIRNALYHLPIRPLIYSYVVGIGGRDVRPEVILDLYQQVLTETTPKVEST